MTYAVYIIVVEDTNAAAEAIGSLGASTVEAALDIETEEQAIAVAEEMGSLARDRIR